MCELQEELERFEMYGHCMADWVKTIIKKKWFTAKKLDKIRKGK